MASYTGKWTKIDLSSDAYHADRSNSDILERYIGGKEPGLALQGEMASTIQSLHYRPLVLKSATWFAE